MATIHDTTMSPSKLELLLSWLPRQPWYAGPDSPELRRAGGFRLDDPAGAVGIELMVVNAVGSGVAVTYHVPMTYRGAPLTDADSALIGTAKHGVLGARWIYDAGTDPVFTEQATQLLRGAVLPQQQSRSDEVDRSVVVQPTADATADVTPRVVRVLREGEHYPAPNVTVTWTGDDGVRRSAVVLTVNRLCDDQAPAEPS
jgi:hypothetical protein